MRVQAISAFNIPKAALPMNISNASNNNANNFKLPGYEVSFGASKAAIRRHKSALDDETRIEIEEAVNTIISDMEFFEDAEEEFLQIDMLVKKFRDNKNALKYIFECSDIKDTPEGASLPALTFLR